MADFYDRAMAVEGQYIVSDIQGNGYWGEFPRQIKARQLEARTVRNPRMVVYLNGGAGLDSGETIFDAQSLRIRMGFEDDAADRVLAFSTCSILIPKPSVNNAPKTGDRIWVRIGVDPVNRVNMFHGQIEDVRESGDGSAYEVVAFDDVRRLQDYPFQRAVTFSDVNGAYVNDYDETTLEAAVQIQIAELLSAADVLTHSLTGIEQYPIMPSNRTTVYEELSALLRASNCRAYLAPTGRLMVTYTDEMPLWATAMVSDMGMRSLEGSTLGLYTRFHLPLLQVRAMFPDRLMTLNEELLVNHDGSVYTQQFQADASELPSTPPRPISYPIFEFHAHNVTAIERVDDSETLNEIRARTSPELDTRDFIDLSGMTFEDLDTLTASQIGDSATSSALDGASVTRYGLRWRTYDSGALAETPRATMTKTLPPGATGPDASVGDFGRCALYRGDFAQSQMRARRFPIERIRITAPGILSLLPFEIVSVNLPRQGTQGYYMIEARRIEMGTGGFRSVDTLRRMDLPEQLVTLDVRDEGEQ